MAPRRHLNIDYLRSLAARRSSHFDGPREVSDFSSLNRRDFLKSTLASAAGVGVGRIWTLGPTLEVVSSRSRVALRLDGQDRFVIDTTIFTGKPTLNLQRQGGNFHISLKNARFPGLDVFADLVLSLSHTLAGWRYQLLFSHCNTAASGDLIAWLRGDATATARWRTTKLADHPRIALSVHAPMLEFTPDWTLRFFGNGVVNASVRNEDLSGDEITLAPYASTERSFVLNADSRSTQIKIKRGSQTWRFDPGLLPPKGARLEIFDPLFDRLSVEVHEKGRERRFGSLFEGDRDRVSLRLTPKPDVLTSDGTPFSLLFSGAACALCPADSEIFFSAGIAAGANLFRLGGLTYRFEDPESGPALEAHADPSSPVLEACVNLSSEANGLLPGATIATAHVPRSAGIPLAFELGRELSDFFHISGDSQRVYANADSLKLKVLRPTDMLEVTLEFRGMNLEHKHSRSSLVPNGDRNAAKMIVNFGPQALLEQVLNADANGVQINGHGPPIKSMAAGPSTLVFLPFANSGLTENSLTELPLEVSALLGWSDWKLSVGDFAIPPIEKDGTLSKDGRLCEGFSYKDVIAPLSGDLVQRLHLEERPTKEPVDVTAIELPYGLIISPNEFARFDIVNQQASPISKRIALWHTRLKTDDIQRNQDQFCNAPLLNIAATTKSVRRLPTTRVIGRRQMVNDLKVPTPLCESDRRLLFESFTTFKGKTIRGDYVPPSMPTRLLALSAMGGWFKGAVIWEPLNSGVSEKENPPSGWIQETSQMRDGRVVITYDGYLMPFGHEATLVFDTHRQWQPFPDKTSKLLYAYDVKTCYLKIPRPMKQFPAAGQPVEGRSAPYNSVEIAIERTPPLDGCAAEAGNKDPCSPAISNTQFWVTVKGDYYRFPLKLADQDGQSQSSSLPALFVPKSDAFDFKKGGRLEKAIKDYNDTAGKDWDVHATNNRAARTVSWLDSQGVAFAPSSKPGDAKFSASRMFWSVESSKDEGLAKLNQPPWYPKMEHAQIELQAVRHFEDRTAASNFAKTDASDSGTYVQFAESYLQHAFERGNEGEALFRISEGTVAPGLKFDPKNAGGLASPSIQIAGVSRKLGPIGGTDIAKAVNSVGAGTFEPSTFFAGPSPKLLGAIDLVDILTAVTGFSDQMDRVPKLIQSDITDVIAAIQAAETDIHNLRDGLNDAVSALNQYRDAAQQQVKDQFSQITPHFDTIAGLVRYVDVPIEFQLPAEQLQEKIHRIRDNFRAEVQTARDLSTLREIIIARVAAGVPQEKLDGLRTSFRMQLLDGEGRVRGTIADEVGRVRRAIDGLRQKVESNLAGANLNGLKSELDEAIKKGVVTVAKSISELLSRLMPVLDDLLTVASIYARAQGELDSLKAQVTTQLDDFAKQITDAKAELEKNLSDEIFGLKNDLEPIRNQLAVIKLQIDQNITGIRTSANTILDRLSNTLDTSGLRTRNPEITKALKDARNLVDGLVQQLRIPQAIHISYEFEPEVHDHAPFLANRKGERDELIPATFKIKADLKKRFDGGSPETKISAVLKDFRLRLLPGAEFIEIPFRELVFESENGGGPKVTTGLLPPVLLGPLDFVDGLSKALDSTGKVKFYLKVLSNGISAGIHFGLPPIPAGSFILSDISFEAGIILPFDESEFAVRLAFAQRTRPFHLTYGVLGGGGFVALELTANGVRQVEAVLEFGAIAELDLDVANGTVAIMGGIYFRQNGKGILLTGYYRACGDLEVLEIVTVSTQFWLTLTYEQRKLPDQEAVAFLVGEAIQSVEIQIGFFSVEASIKLRREFSKSGGSGTALNGREADPNSVLAAASDANVDNVSDDDWQQRYLDYAATYAW